MNADRGLRMTDQRRVLLEVLRKTRTHPTADELFEAVRRRLPRISLGTVYRNLERLSEYGLVRRLEAAGGPMRFDGDIRPHYHVRCLSCGRLGDVAAPPQGIRIPKDLDSDFVITGFDVEFIGLCPACAAAKPPGGPSIDDRQPDKERP